MELERCLVQAESESDRRGIRVSWQLAEELRSRTGGGATGGAAANQSHASAWARTGQQAVLISSASMQVPPPPTRRASIALTMALNCLLSRGATSSLDAKRSAGMDFQKWRQRRESADTGLRCAAGYIREDLFSYAGLRCGLGGFMVRAGPAGSRQSPPVAELHWGQGGPWPPWQMKILTT